MSKPTFEIRRHGPLSIEMRSDKFRNVILEGAPGILLFLFEGDIPFEAFHHTAELMDACLKKRGRISLVGNGGNWANYGDGYREGWTTWFTANKANINSVDLLIRSAFLRLGVQIVNMVTRGVITTYSSLGELKAGVHKRFPTLDLSPILPDER